MSTTSNLLSSAIGVLGAPAPSASPCECDDCCVCHGHEWVVENHNNGVGHHWIEMECKHCDADPTDEEVEDATTYDDEPVRD